MVVAGVAVGAELERGDTVATAADVNGGQSDGKGRTRMGSFGMDKVVATDNATCAGTCGSLPSPA